MLFLQLYSTFVLTKFLTPQIHQVAQKAMRKLQPGRFENVTEGLPKYLVTTKKSQLQIKTYQQTLQQRVIDGLRSLEAQAEHINQLSADLEEAMFELKAIASEVNKDLRTIQATTKPFLRQQQQVPEICQYWKTSVPHVGQKPSGALVLTTRQIDLFKAEREAALIAKELRQRATRKRR